MSRRTRLLARLDALRVRVLDATPDHLPSTAGRPTTIDDSIGRLESAVTRHLRADAEARAVARRVASVLDALPQGIVLVDDSASTIFRNRAASVFVAARHSDALVESTVAELTAGAGRGEFESRTLDLYGPPRRVLQIKATRLREFSGSSQVDGPGVSMGGVCLTIDDITERQHLEAVRRDFVANVSHELKTPIGALGVLAETLLEENDLEVVHRMTARMHVEAFRVAQTIDDLLSLSRIEAGWDGDLSPVSVGAVVQEAINRETPLADRRSVRFCADLPSTEVIVQGDHRQLVSAVANLCGNAAKYSEDGATVEVAVRVDDKSVVVEVIDQGIGIPTRDLERIFERFYRVDRARSRDTGGTGLGLSIVRHIAHNHGGEVSVRSREGNGSTFTLLLPHSPTVGSHHEPVQP